MNMNKTLWKLQQIGERLWILAVTMTQQAAGLGGADGRDFAIVAEETRRMSNKINQVIEHELFEGEEKNKKFLTDLAFQLNLLALNAVVVANRTIESDAKGRAVAVSAEEIRALAYEIVTLFDDKLEERVRQAVNPYPKNPLTTINQSHSFLLFSIAGIPVKENLINIREVNGSVVKHTGSRIDIRGEDLPLVNAYKILNKPYEPANYITLRTPWAAQNQTIVVAADRCDGVITNPLGMNVAPPADMPLAKYVRECWENENGDPFYFMDWAKMI